MNGDHQLGGSSGGGDSSRSVSPGIASLANLGNTCFLNSVLYTLRFTPGFCHSLHHLNQDLQARARLENGRTSSSSSSSSQKADTTDQEHLLEVIHALHHLFQKLCSSDGYNGDPKDPVLPSALLQSIGRLCPLFEGNQQQDAHELLVTLLTHLQDVKVTSPESPRPESQLSQHSTGADEGQRLPLPPPPLPNKSGKKKNSQSPNNGGSTSNLSHTQDPAAAAPQNGIDKVSQQPVPATSDRKDRLSSPSACPNFVKENFVGIGVMRTKCLECESSTFKKEEFTNIDIPIQCDEEEEESAYNFFINRILASETLRDVNKYWCSECSRLNEAQRTVSYEVLPSVLVLQLKRFTTTASRAYVSKLTDYIPTPLIMDCFCQKCRDGAGPPLHRYRLYSVILHLGASMASGHYIACVRAADINLDYFQCSRPGGLIDTATRIKHTKHRGLFKMFTSKSSSAAPPEPAYGVTNPVCGSIGCCGLKMNPNLVSGDEQQRSGPASLPPSSSSGGGGVANGHSGEGSNGSSPRYSPGGGRPDSAGPGSAGDQDIWLECDDEQISVITRQQLEELLTSRQPTTTPYLLFYNRIC